MDPGRLISLVRCIKKTQAISYQKKTGKDKVYSLRNSGFNAASVNQDPQAVSALLGKTSCVDCMKIAVLPGENTEL